MTQDQEKASLTVDDILSIGRRAMDKCHGTEAQHIYIAREVERRLQAAPAAVPAEHLPTAEHIRELAQEALDQIMEQAQVFASAWSLVGGRFDSGNAMSDAEDAKAELRTMVRSLADLAAETVRPAAPQPAQADEAPAEAHGLNDLRRDLIADTREVFDASGSETPQFVRDVIEYVDSWLQVQVGRAADRANVQPKGANMEHLSITLDTSGIRAELAEYQREAAQLSRAPAPVPVAFYVYEWRNPSDGAVFRSFRPDEHHMGRQPDNTIAVSAPAPAPEPVAVRYDFDGYGWKYIDNGSGSDWMTRHPDGELLYDGPCAAVAHAAAPQPEAQPQWRPIETAPKDGSMFMCWIMGVRYGETDEGQQYQEDISQVDFCWWRDNHGNGYFDPACGQIADSQDVTHWMPLPAAPSAQAEQADQAPAPGAEIAPSYRHDYPASERVLGVEREKAREDERLYGVGFTVNGWHVPAPVVACLGMENKRENERRHAALAPALAAPAGYKLVAVKGFDEMVQAMDRAVAKGYMPDAMADEWDAFDWEPVSAPTNGAAA